MMPFCTPTTQDLLLRGTPWRHRGVCRPLSVISSTSFATAHVARQPRIVCLLPYLSIYTLVALVSYLYRPECNPLSVEYAFSIVTGRNLTTIAPVFSLAFCLLSFHSTV